MHTGAAFPFHLRPGRLLWKVGYGLDKQQQGVDSYTLLFHKGDNDRWKDRMNEQKYMFAEGAPI